MDLGCGQWRSQEVFLKGSSKHNKILMYKKIIKKKILISQINFNLTRMFLHYLMALKSLVIDAKLNWCKQHEMSFLLQALMVFMRDFSSDFGFWWVIL